MMLPAIIFPDVELWATNYLRDQLTKRPEDYAHSVFVSNRVPDNRRDRMVIIRRDGGPRLDVIREAARINIQVWAGTEQDATDLARLVDALIWAAPDGKPVCKAEKQSGPMHVPDGSQQPMVMIVYELIIRGADL